MNNILWTDLYSALALVLIIEGFMPFINPEKWRDLVGKLSKQPNKLVRIYGLFFITVGTVSLWYFRNPS
jgi:uncharacterized protein YjeT (DUF2065 family)